MNHQNKIKSLTKTLRFSYLFLLSITIIPTAYSIIVSRIHTQQYNIIIKNVSNANKINQIAKNDIPNELWDIVCGRKDFNEGRQYEMMSEISESIDAMYKHSMHRETLEVANRTSTTLLRNINLLGMQIKSGSSVTNNEMTLDEIRTITSLFSDIMRDFIVEEIKSASETNKAINISSITLTIIQLLITIFAILISISSFITVSNAIREPISDMENLSTKVANGDLTARIEIPNVEELDTLAKNLNKMTGQIDILIKKNIEEQKNFQKAEMKALQAQITPHFLYNTFDTIIWLAEEENSDEVVKITKAFSDFLRISLSRGHEWIKVCNEIDHIRNYLTIQKIRYADILDYEIEVEPELYEYKIIKLILQPLVENAIYHGIKNKRGRGKLKVTVRYVEKYPAKGNSKLIEFIVEDNGVGFTPERFESVITELKEGAKNAENLNSVYGLYNVNKKLKLYYEEKTSGLIIKSEPNRGSRISFIVPADGGDENV